MGITKRAITRNTDGLAPLFWAIIILGGLAITGVAVYQITARPDITYNISETGFSLAGVDVSWFAIIGLGLLIFIVFIWLGRRKPAEPPSPPRYYYPPPPRY